MERIEAIKDYYTNLEYHQNSIEEVLTKITDLADKINFNYEDRTLDRRQAVASIIKENFSLFVSACRHIDVVTAILEYLTNFSTRIEQQMMVQTYNMEDAEYLTMVTVANISNEIAVKSFLVHFLTKNRPIEYAVQQCDRLVFLGLSLAYTSEMIILEDSDLYAVINCLMMTKSFPLYKIWVQELVKEQFCWLIKKSCHSDLPIHTFQSLKDIEFYRCHNEHSTSAMNITSIWSEDIVTAKNLALSLNKHVVYINTYMDFNGGAVLLPYKQLLGRMVYEKTFNARCNSDSDSKPSENAIYFSHTPRTEFSFIHNLFYDGMLQKPVKGMYWKYNDALWAIATNEDITRCYDSAKKGFEVWSNKSIKSRIQILSKLQIIFQSAGKSLLAAIIAKWLKFPYIYKNLQGFYSRNDKVEVMCIRMPLSVIILRGEKENVLFFRLIQTLIAGNSVIVIFDADFCNLVPYYDMFSTCGLPPGVINFLSHDNVSVLERKFGIDDYTLYAERIFSTKGKSKETYIVPYKNLTLPKQIILPLK